MDKVSFPTTLQEVKNLIARNPLPSEPESTPKWGKAQRLNVSSLDHTFENWKTSPGTMPAYRACLNFAKNLKPPLLLVHGGTGNGKSFLIEAVSLALYDRGYKVRVIIWNQFTGLLQRAFDNREEMLNFDQLMTNYSQARILLLDDYGMGIKNTEWQESILERIIDYRYHQWLPTILTTNRTLDKLPVRVVSRFSDPERSVLIENKGGDYRRMVKG